MSALILPALNFAILIVILAVALKKPLKEYARQRHLTIRQDVETVRESLRRAHEQHEEFTAKLKAIDVETSSLRAQIKQDAQSAKSRIFAEAQRLSSGIVTDARGAATGLYNELRDQLALDLGTRVLDRAETLMRERLTGDDKARIRQEFSRQVEGIQ